MPAEVNNVKCEYFTFLNTNKSEKLLQLISNYINLGHLELARASLLQFFGENEQEALTLLRSLICFGIPADSFAIKSQISAHVLWFFYIEFEILRKKSTYKIDPIPKIIIGKIEFDLVLYQLIELTQSRVNENLNSDFLQIVRSYYHAITKTLKHNKETGSENLVEIKKFSNHTLDVLKKLLSNQTEIAHLLCKYLTPDLISDEYEWSTEQQQILIENHTQIYNIYLSLIELFLDQSNFESLCLMISYFDIFPNTPTLPANTYEYIRAIFERIIILCHNQEKRKKNSLSSLLTTSNLLSLKHKIYQSFLSSKNNYLIKLYTEMEDFICKQLLLQNENSNNVQNIDKKSDTSLNIFSLKSKSPNLFWQEYYNYLRVTDNHMFEHILLRSLELVKSNRVRDSQIYLSKFPELKPLLLLCCFHNFIDDMATLQIVMDSLYDSHWNIGPDALIIDRHILDYCCFLFYQLKLSLWISRKLIDNNLLSKSHHYLKGSGSSQTNVADQSSKKKKSSKNNEIIYKVAGKILQDLQKYSLLHIWYITNSLHFLQIDEVSHLLQIQSLDSKKTQYEKDRDFLMISGHCILKDIMILITNKSEHQFNSYEDSSDESGDELASNSYEYESLSTDKQLIISKVKRGFSNIKNIPFKIKLIEQIIGFLFLNDSQLKKQEQQNKNSNEKIYLATATNTKAILKLLLETTSFDLKEIEKLLVQIDQQQQMEQEMNFENSENQPKRRSGGTLENLQILQTIKNQLNQLIIIIKEGLWRYDIITENSSNDLKKNYQFIPRLCASPDSLLMLCIRKKDFNHCNEIIEYFSLNSEISKLAQYSKRYHILSIEIQDHCDSLESIDFKKSDSNSISIVKRINEIYKDYEDENKLLSFMDTLFTSISGPSFSNYLLEQATELFAKISNTNQLSNKLASVIHESLEKLKFIQKIKEKINFSLFFRSNYSIDFINLPISNQNNSTTSSINLPGVNSTSIGFGGPGKIPLNLYEEQLNSLELVKRLYDLFEIFSDAELLNLNSKENFITPITNKLSNEEFNDISAIIKKLDTKKINPIQSPSKFWNQTGYFHNFIQHLTDILQILEESEKLKPSENSIFTLPFANDASKLEELTITDKLITILQTTPDDLVGRLVFEKNDYLSAEKLSVLFKQDLIKGILHSIHRSARDSLYSISLISLPNTLNQKLSSLSTHNMYLTESILEYIHSRIPLLSIFVCLFKHPTQQFSSNFYNLLWNLVNKIYVGKSNSAKNEFNQNRMSAGPGNANVNKNQYLERNYSVLLQYVYSKLNEYSYFSTIMHNIQQPFFLLTPYDMNFIFNLQNQQTYLSSHVSASSHSFLNKQNLQFKANPIFSPGASGEQTSGENQAPSPFKYVADHYTDKQKDIYELIASESSDSEAYYTKLIKELLKQEKYSEALFIRDTYVNPMPNQQSKDFDNQSQLDEILEKLIYLTEDKSVVWKFIGRMENKQVASKYFFKFMEHWDIDVCLDMLKMLMKYPMNDAKLENDIKAIHFEFEIYKQTSQLDKSWSGWQEIANICRNNPERIISQLTKLGNHELARKISIVFAVAGVKKDIEKEHLIELMKSPSGDMSDASQALIMLKSDAIPIAESILSQLQQGKRKGLSVDQTIKMQLFLLQFLISQCSQFPENRVYLSLFTVDSLQQTQIGLKALQLLPDVFTVNYLKLSTFPQLIVECLIQTEQVEELAKILWEIPQLQNDEILLKYAEKLLDCSQLESRFSIPVTPLQSQSQQAASFSSGQKSETKISRQSTGPPTLAHQNSTGSIYASGSAMKRQSIPINSSSIHQIQRDVTKLRLSDRTRERKFKVNDERGDYLRLNEELKFSGDPREDNVIRESFTFPTAPNIALFKSFISLCKDRTKAAEKCIEFANKLSKLLNNYSKDTLILITITKEVLLSAKCLLLSLEKSTEVCDNLLEHLELLQSLTLSKIQLNISLLDFNDEHKNKVLRDKLIKEDQLKLALEVAQKCKIDEFPVWYSWGLNLLRAGRYSDAKEKFVSCLKEFKTQQEEESDQYSINLMSVDDFKKQDELIQQIIEIIEVKPVDESKILRERLMELSKKKPGLPGGKSSSENLAAAQGGPTGPSRNRKPINQLDTERYMQCIYYLTRYASPLALVSFWIRHDSFEDAVRYCFNQNLPAQFFVEEIALRMIRRGGISYFKDIIRRAGLSFFSFPPLSFCPLIPPLITVSPPLPLSFSFPFLSLPLPSSPISPCNTLLLLFSSFSLSKAYFSPPSNYSAPPSFVWREVMLFFSFPSLSIILSRLMLSSFEAHSNPLCHPSPFLGT